MKRASRHRPERLAALIHETLAEGLAREVKDPRVGFVTVTGVQVTPDGAHAVVRVSVLGEEADKQRAVEGLDSARGFLRSLLAKRLALRIAPELRFQLDRSLEHARKIDQILDQLKQDTDPAE
ncbi:MAG: 30S ribosome-binding factor RbfA [Gemmatimonadota bacterium]|nr:30S ribosome-binding factor RbfA [Gemmatimonadota bacterium]